MKNVQHSSEEARWGTAPNYVAVGRAVLGIRRASRGEPITVDPYSEDKFNLAIGALHILTGERGRDGYKDRWLPDDACPRADMILAGFDVAPPAVENENTANVNPPGGEDGDNVKRAWKLVDEYHRLGWLGGGVMWTGFSLNQLQTLQGESERSPFHGDFLRCIPAKRQPFVRHTAVPDQLDAPSQPSFIVLLPSLDDIVAAEQARVFYDLASRLGEVW